MNNSFSFLFPIGFHNHEVKVIHFGKVNLTLQHSFMSILGFKSDSLWQSIYHSNDKNPNGSLVSKCLNYSSILINGWQGDMSKVY